LPGASTSPRPT